MTSPPTAAPTKGIAGRDFLTVAVSNLVSRMGTVVFDVVLAWWLVQRTGSTVASGFVLAASTLPIAVLSPLSGVFVDRWNKKRVLVATDAVSAASALAVAVMAHQNIVSIPALVVCSALLGVCASLFKPAIRAVVPAVVAKESLARANSLTTNFAETTKVVGPVIGASLMAVPGMGVPGALLTNAVSFALSALAQATITFRPMRPKTAKESVREGLSAGLRYIRSRRLVRDLLLMCGLVNFFLVSFTILLPLYVTDVLAKGSGAYSSALTAEALGGVAVTVLFLARRDIRPKPTQLVWYVSGTGLSLALIPVVPTWSGLLVLSFAQGALMGAFNTLYFTYVQEVVAPEFLGRVFSLVYMVAVAVMPASYLVFGYLGEHVVTTAFLYTGIGTILISLPFLRMRQDEGGTAAAQETEDPTLAPASGVTAADADAK
ncbi:MFS transporter [Streptomyces sp. NPDC006393]|uniref:MFS transporter n=1 Tax=Streptomyces sp. NPDC006393 TaxID=3156763 RepID=UPI00340D04F5